MAVRIPPRLCFPSSLLSAASRTQTPAISSRKALRVDVAGTIHNSQRSRDLLFAPRFLFYSLRTEEDPRELGESRAAPCSAAANNTICCDRTAFRTDVCFMRGDVRTHSPSKSMLLFRQNSSGHEPLEERIRPYTRKWEIGTMDTIDELRLRTADHRGETPAAKCDVTHDVPAVVFSTGGYTGNVYHEFNDGIIPLYITSQRFNRKVVFVILEYHDWWITKYGDVIARLSDHPPIDFSNDPRTHCFPEAIVGLRIHDELTVDAARMESNKTIRDFRQLLDEAFAPRVQSIIWGERKRASPSLPKAGIEENESAKIGACLSDSEVCQKLGREEPYPTADQFFQTDLSPLQRWMDSDTWRWALGLTYIVAVAVIWIVASYIVQSVVDAGVSPFLITNICNSLNTDDLNKQQSSDMENVNLLQENNSNMDPHFVVSHNTEENVSEVETQLKEDSNIMLSSHANEFTLPEQVAVNDNCSKDVDAKGRWTCMRVAGVSLLICPFWFFAQLTFNLSLKYTTVTSNTILSSTSSLFTFLVAIAFLGEKFTWVKLISVLLCMGGTIIVSMADSNTGVNAIAASPLLGDILALLSAGLYAMYITLIRKMLPDEKKGEGQASVAQFLGFLGLFNLLIFLPVALVLHFTSLEPFHKLIWKQFSLIVGKGLLDSVLSDLLWAKAVQLTTTTVATAGLTIQVPMAAVVDSLTGNAPHLMDYVGAAAVMLGFAGINIPSYALSKIETTQQEQESDCVTLARHHLELPMDRGTTAVS